MIGPIRIAVSGSDGEPVDAEIVAAADANVPRWERGSKPQIMLSVTPELLEQVDKIAGQDNLVRAALLTVWINEQIARRL
jgi:hypothetical protein